MILAHVSDLHLGFRAYGRVERGRDVRETDVARAFERAVQEIIEIRPDLLVMVGDIFDRPEPPAGALVALSRGLEGLRSSLPETPVLMVAGPRDTPRRRGDPGVLAVLDTFPNVEAAAGLPRSILMERLDLHVSLIPHRAAVGERTPVVAPDPRARWNLLVLHARASGGRGRPFPLDAEEWDYVALGGEHRQRRLAPHVRYPGSLERVSLDPWGEAAEEKGFLVADLARGEVSFHAIPGRAVAALAPIRVVAGEPERLRRKVEEVVEEVPGGIDEKIVRLKLEGVGPHDVLALQGEQLHRLRKRALHLAVEADQELHVVPGGWAPEDAPARLREAVERELERDGLVDAATRDVVRALIPEVDVDGPPARIFGQIETVTGEVPELGPVSLELPEGLIAVIGGGGRTRRALAQLIAEAGGAGDAAALAALCAGTGAESLDDALHVAVRAVAEVRGLDVVERAASAALEMGGIETEEPRDVTEDRARSGAVRDDPEMVSAELRAAKREVRSLRAESAVLKGDLDATTMEWFRERQDAETTLHVYRDRARELKVRLRQLEAAGPEAPCPLCGRTLESHHEEVLSELRNEWESVVQDGSWWKSRREQLELKPESLQELEGRALRVHAALEAGSERVELLKVRLAELHPISGADRPDTGRRTGTGAVARAIARVRDARMAVSREAVLSRASTYVVWITGGRILAVTCEGATTELQGDLGPLRPRSEEDLAAGRLALRLAAASMVAGTGRLKGLVVEEPFDRLDEEARIRTLSVIRRLLRNVARVILFSRGESVDARPEAFDRVFELRDDAAGDTPAIRSAPAAFARLAVVRAPQPGRSRAARS